MSLSIGHWYTGASAATAAGGLVAGVDSSASEAGDPPHAPSANRPTMAPTRRKVWLDCRLISLNGESPHNDITDHVRFRRLDHERVGPFLSVGSYAVGGQVRSEFFVRDIAAEAESRLGLIEP